MDTITPPKGGTGSNPVLVNPPEGIREASTSSIPSNGKNDKAENISTEEQSKGREDNLGKVPSDPKESSDDEGSSITDGGNKKMDEKKIPKESEGTSLEEPSDSTTIPEKDENTKNSDSTDDTPANPRVEKTVSNKKLKSRTMTLTQTTTFHL